MTSPQSQMHGFTLIELMIAVAIVGILLAIAIPNYDEYKKRGFRSEGSAFLTDIAARQERYYAQKYEYITSNSDLDKLGLSTNMSSTEKYELTLGDDATGYLLTATQKFGDTKCGNLTLDGAGTRGNTGTGLSAEDCWR